MKSTSGVYQITNTATGECYIGSTDYLTRRWRHHQDRLARKLHHSRLLQCAWNQYGETAFTFSVVEYVDASQLKERERAWIGHLRPAYNIDLNPDAHRISKGRPRSPETRAKISAALMGNRLALGYVHTPETRAKISAALTGRSYSPETLAKMSAAKKGRPLSPEHRAKLSRPGHPPSHTTPMSATARAKISAALKGRVRSPEHSAAISAALTRHRLTAMANS
jgi:group I intron endonuclease